ncbi:hypothetical protein CRG98_018524 [Punica granatum]|uniref:Uncharacterized protein n=1 Tax=Punica granatum TaxID=22663 RepID=A0A2I0JXN2_PUNGR|nr:hypothetical protein CRG98_018524 [Punica granatum]
MVLTAKQGNPGLAGAGGLLRDGNGQRISGIELQPDTSACIALRLLREQGAGGETPGRDRCQNRRRCSSAAARGSTFRLKEPDPIATHGVAPWLFQSHPVLHPVSNSRKHTSA